MPQTKMRNVAPWCTGRLKIAAMLPITGIGNPEKRMDTTAIAATATAMQQTKTDQAISIAVLKKALDTQASSAAALLDALPPVTPANLPPHLGQNINTVA
jgi:hypothetical protein